MRKIETMLGRRPCRVSFFDPIPLSIYGSQFIASGLIAWVKIAPLSFHGIEIDGSYAFFASVGIVVLILCIASLQKVRFDHSKRLRLRPDDADPSN